MKVLAITGLLACLAIAADAQTYRWTDSQGVIHFTDSYESVPSGYRDTVGKEEDITVRNPKIREEVRQEEERARLEEASRPRVAPQPEVAPPPPAPVKPTAEEERPPRPKSVRVRENVERREAEEKAQQAAKPGY